MPRHSRAFTLTELLVTIAVVGLLAALLIPGLSAGKLKSRATQCANNLRQLGIACHLYSDDADGRLVSNPPHGAAGSTEFIPSWVRGRMKFDQSESTNSLLLESKEFGTIASYGTSAQLYHCPSDVSYSVFEGKRIRRVRSFAMNAYLGDSPLLLTLLSTLRHYRRLEEVVSPSETFQLIDEHADTIDTPVFTALVSKDLNYYPTFQSYPASNHGRSANVSFVDGHVELKRWSDNRTILKSSRSRPKQYEHTGNQDVMWLRMRASHPK